MKLQKGNFKVFLFKYLPEFERLNPPSIKTKELSRAYDEYDEALKSYTQEQNLVHLLNVLFEVYGEKVRTREEFDRKFDQIINSFKEKLRNEVEMFCSCDIELCESRGTYLRTDVDRFLTLLNKSLDSSQTGFSVITLYKYVISPLMMYKPRVVGEYLFPITPLTTKELDLRALLTVLGNFSYEKCIEVVKRTFKYLSAYFLAFKDDATTLLPFAGLEKQYLLKYFAEGDPLKFSRMTTYVTMKNVSSVSMEECSTFKSELLKFVSTIGENYSKQRETKFREREITLSEILEIMNEWKKEIQRVLINKEDLEFHLDRIKEGTENFKLFENFFLSLFYYVSIIYSFVHSVLAGKSRLQYVKEKLIKVLEKGDRLEEAKSEYARAATPLLETERYLFDLDPRNLMVLDLSSFLLSFSSNGSLRTGYYDWDITFVDTTRLLTLPNLSDVFVYLGSSLSGKLKRRLSQYKAILSSEIEKGNEELTIEEAVQKREKTYGERLSLFDLIDGYNYLVVLGKISETMETVSSRFDFGSDLKGEFEDCSELDYFMTMFPIFENLFREGYEVILEGFVRSVTFTESVGAVNTVRVTGTGPLGFLGLTRVVFSPALFSTMFYDVSELYGMLEARTFTVFSTLFAGQDPLSIITCLLSRVLRLRLWERVKSAAKGSLKSREGLSDDKDYNFSTDGSCFVLDEVILQLENAIQLSYLAIPAYIFLKSLEVRGFLCFPSVVLLKRDSLFQDKSFLKSWFSFYRSFVDEMRSIVGEIKEDVKRIISKDIDISSVIEKTIGKYVDLCKKFFSGFSEVCGKFRIRFPEETDLARSFVHFDRNILEEKSVPAFFYIIKSSVFRDYTPEFDSPLDIINNRIKPNIFIEVFEEYHQRGVKFIVRFPRWNDRPSMLSDFVLRSRSYSTGDFSQLVSRQRVTYALDFNINIPFGLFSFTSGKVLSRYGFHEAPPYSSPIVKMLRDPSVPEDEKVKGKNRDVMLRWVDRGIFKFAKFLLDYRNYSLKTGTLSCVWVSPFTRRHFNLGNMVYDPAFSKVGYVSNVSVSCTLPSIPAFNLTLSLVRDYVGGRFIRIPEIKDFIEDLEVESVSGGVST